MNLIQYTIKDSEEMKKIIILDRCYLDLAAKGLDYNSIVHLIRREKEVLFDKVHNAKNFNYFLRRIEGIDADDLIDMTDEEKEPYWGAFEDYLFNEIEDIYRKLSIILDII